MYRIPGFLLAVAILSCKNKEQAGTAATKPDTISIHPEFNRYFDSCHTVGAIAIYDNQEGVWHVSDTISTKMETLPASTFKIINLLIALETKVIADEKEVVKWVGHTDTVKYGYRPDIYRDMSVEDAFRLSAGWVFVELAKKIGKENYKKYLAMCHYGNLDLSQEDSDFWNFGNFGISPFNQVQFLKALYDGSLPFAKRNMDIVKQVMVAEQQEGVTIRAKTGWTRDGGINTGWWVGYLENKQGVYFFATRLVQDRKDNSPGFGNCRKEITKAVCRDLNILP